MIHWFEPGGRDLFAAAGLAQLGEFSTYRGGEVVTKARTRVCRRVVLGGRAFYVKVQNVPPGELPLRKWLSYLGRGSPLAREAVNLGRLEKLGVRVPVLVAAGANRRWWGMPRVAVLITAELEGYVDLAGLATSAPERAMAAAREVSALMKRIHDQGWGLGGLKYRNVLVGPEGEIALLDLPNLGRDLTGRARKKDRLLLAAEQAKAFPCFTPDS